MGEVYRATDNNLKRSVAIKVLPASVAGDVDRLTRFQREAEVVAALNHTNIAAIYGLEKTPDFTALVMELVEGEDLSQRISRGPIPLDEVLSIARQIADALEAAHEQGIIHRDLKPANIKVRPDGTVKVLDFGLAKVMVGDAVSSGAGSHTISPTFTSPAMMTSVGMILGTAAYMAPEQARGKAVDKRADIWAFGVVLYEMLTGTRAFGDEDVSMTLSKILQREPDFAALPSPLPARVSQALRVCLRKDPKQRAGDIRDVRLVLEGAFETVAAQPVASLPSPAPRRPLSWIAAFAVAAVMVGALAVPAVRHLRETLPPETRVDIVTPATGQPSHFALSPDGRQVVFVASDEKTSRLWLRPLSSTTSQPLAGTEGASFPFWSPDSDSVGFFAGGALKRIDLGGGAPKILAPATNGSGGTWNADGVIAFAPNLTSPLLRVPATGGAAVAVTTLGAQQFGHFHPQFLPDGHRFLFTVGGSADVSGIYLGGLDGSSPTRLVSDFASGVHAPAGWLLWLRAGSLMAQRLDAERPALTGEPMELADGVATDSGFARSAISVAATGLVAYRTAGAAQRQLTWFDRTGMARGVAGEPDGSVVQPRVSPDGRRVALVRTVQGLSDIWLLDGARASRFTFDPAQDFFPIWSPDSTRIVYTSRAGSGIGALFQKLTNGAGAEEPFLTTDQTLTPTSWSADGRFLMYMSIDPKTSSDIWVVPMSGNAGDRKPFLFLKTPFREAYGVFSPDGRWVAYHSNESGRPEIYVRPFIPPSRQASTLASATADKSPGRSAVAAGTAAPTAGGQWQVSVAGGILPLWRSDGKELYYVNPDGAMMAASITITGTSVEPGRPVMLFPTRMVGGGADIQLGRQYDVTADGRFLVNTLLNEAPAPITLLQNWQPPSK